MFQLCIGLGASFLNVFTDPFSNLCSVLPKVRQHRIILSNRIIEYYRKKLPDYLLDVFDTFIDDTLYSEQTSISYDDDNSYSDVREELIHFVSLQQFKILVGYKEEFNNLLLKGINILTPENIISDPENAINKYSIPIVNYVIEPRTSCSTCARWFGRLLENDGKITIVDKYIMSNRGVGILNTFYFPYIKEGVDIDIYCEFGECGCEQTEELFGRIAPSVLSKHTISIFFCKDMHDRYILSSRIKLSIEKGLDFLLREGSTDTQCTINVSERRNINFPPLAPFLEPITRTRQ